MKYKINEKEARKMLEEMKVSQSQIDEFINNLPKTDEEEETQMEELRQRGIYLAELQKKYDEETDPYKKSALVAQKISLSLED